MRRILLGFAVALVLGSSAVALPPQGPTLPIFRSQVPAGEGRAIALPAARDPQRKVDGNISDWRGSLPGFGGALIYSHGELVYEDHIFDAFGPDNGQNTARLALLDPATQAVPEFYRLDPAYQYVPGEFGIPTGPLTPGTNYGMDPMEAQADLSEVRLGTDPHRNLWLLARTTSMDDAHPATAILVLLDTGRQRRSTSVPFNSGLRTSRADVAIYLHGRYGAWVDLADPSHVKQLPAGSVATNPRGYTNAIEARVPASLLHGHTHHVRVGVASGLANDRGTGFRTLPVQPNVANVAFRLNEPARNWWEKEQALELYKGTMDSFLLDADLGRMAAGANERYQPGPGYHDRIFTSTRRISSEQGNDGILQHYGVYIPSSYRVGTATPTQFWFHFRGGDAHIAAAVVPGVIWDMGERAHSLVITPDGRGDSGWYVGKSQQDVLEVWKDSHRLFSIDPNRTYIAGHSMGGWASYLLAIEHPDWFAASFPASGPVTQGAYTGADIPGCDRYTYQDYSPCFVQANGGDARAEYTEPLLENLRWVPFAIYQGTNDELVPTSGVTLQVKRLQELGYRYRYYLFPGQEHYGPPIVDQWTEGTNYEHQFVRNPNPPEVTYIRSMVFERAIESVNSSGVSFSFPLDRAYWMSGLQPLDVRKGVARFDGRSLAISDPRHIALPETSPPLTTNQNYPYVMAGQTWQTVGAAGAARNGFVISTTGARAVTLDLPRMRLDLSRPLTGEVTCDASLRLRMSASLQGAPVVKLDGKALPPRIGRGRLDVVIPRGHHQLSLLPRAR